MFCRDTCSRIGYDELMGVRATFLEVEADTSLLRIESGIFQQVEQDTFQLFFIRFYLEFGGVYRRGDVRLHKFFSLLHDAFAESTRIDFSHFIRFGQ